MDIAPLPEICVDGARVSSTRVRRALADGRPDQAARLLGHSYRVSGRVVTGERLGRTLGFPTLNIRLARRPAPRYGVYAVEVGLADGTRRSGAASFGVRPTVNGREPLLEVYLLDFEGDLYGQRVDVSFESFIREEVRFDSLEALTDQTSPKAVAARRGKKVVDLLGRGGADQQTAEAEAAAVTE